MREQRGFMPTDTDILADLERRLAALERLHEWITAPPDEGHGHDDYLKLRDEIAELKSLREGDDWLRSEFEAVAKERNQLRIDLADMTAERDTARENLGCRIDAHIRLIAERDDIKDERDQLQHEWAEAIAERDSIQDRLAALAVRHTEEP